MKHTRVTPSGMDWERIGRYLAGEASAEEAAEVRRWLDQHRSDAELVAALERITAGIRGARVDVDAALRKVKTRPTPVRAKPAIPAPGRWRRWMTRTEFVAAAAAVILVAGVFVFQQVRSYVRGGNATYTTGIGQRDSVRLADGSLVLLGPATRVAVRDREIDLTGEAFFRVKHDDGGKPFIVRAGGSVIRDIGTEFTVESDDGAAAVRVVVQEGSVALRRGADSVMLRQGDIGRATANRVEAVAGGATPEDFAWMRGELVFRDAPIAQVVADLRRWYGVEVRVAAADTALLERRFTGTFTTESRDRVLDVIAMALPARVERRGDTAYFRPATSTR